MRRPTTRTGRMLALTLPAALALAVAACGLEESQAPDPPRDPLGSLPRELTPAEQRVVASSNDFAFALLARAAADSRGANLVLSPLSASMALGMLVNGATGQTRAEMLDALRLAGVEDAHVVNTSYLDLLAMLTDLDGQVRFDVANAIWAREGVDFERAFLDSAVAYFDATVRTLDFTDPASVDVINDWVAGQTGDRIDQIIDDIDPAAVMFLMNAIYFKGDWTRPFDPRRTQPAPFTRADGSTVEVPMMDMDEAPHLFAQREDGTTLVDLAYSRGAYSMTLVLPPEGQGALDFAASLDRARWDDLVASLDTVQRVLVRMPRFTIEHERVLNDDLRALGMRRAFTDQAEFDALTAEAVYVHEVRQKTFVAVDEVGTEAAAVTSIEMRVVSMPPHIFLDRPFFFAIRERLSGVVLFVGVVGDPGAR